MRTYKTDHQAYTAVAVSGSNAGTSKPTAVVPAELCRAVEDDLAIMQECRDNAVASLQEVYRDAVRLAKILCRNEFFEVSHVWTPLNDTRGVLSQIDNMAAGMSQKLEVVRAAYIEAKCQLDEALDRIAELEKQLAGLQKPKEQHTFRAHDLTWVKHVPGDPMPCYGDAKIRALLRCGAHGPATGSQLDWSEKQGDEGQIIGWNYADAP